MPSGCFGYSSEKSGVNYAITVGLSLPFYCGLDDDGDLAFGCELARSSKTKWCLCGEKMSGVLKSAMLALAGNRRVLLRSNTSSIM